LIATSTCPEARLTCLERAQEWIAEEPYAGTTLKVATDEVPGEG